MDNLGFSPYLLSVACAWAIAQLMKYIMDAVKSKELSNVSLIYKSGGMPSIHSAVVVAVATSIAILDGVASGLFALSVVIAIIVMYDALQVRRAVGEQGLAVAELLRKNGDKAHIPYFAKGHTPLEVTVGGIVGLTVAIFITTFSR